jgi:hypothetical protein
MLVERRVARIQRADQAPVGAGGPKTQEGYNG